MSENTPSDDGKDDKKSGWLSRMLVRSIDPGRESHSTQLSDKDTVYELQSVYYYILVYLLRMCA